MIVSRKTRRREFRLATEVQLIYRIAYDYQSAQPPPGPNVQSQASWFLVGVCSATPRIRPFAGFYIYCLR